MNRFAELLTGWTQVEAKGKPIEEIFNIVDEFTREKRENIAKKVIKTGKTLELPEHTLLISKDSIERALEDSVAPIVQESGEVAGAVIVFRDFSEKKHKQEKIEFLSYHDQLTGLYNRRFYEEELKRLDTKRNLPLTIVMGDVNGLKLTNDSFGHSVGDQMLKKAAGAMELGCRDDDIIARIGGDEFVVLLPKTDAAESEKIIKRIKVLLSKEKLGAIDLSVSFGYETKNNEEENVAAVIKKADDYMYKRKVFESPRMRANTISAIINTLHEKNREEEQHLNRVSRLCKSMGEALGLEEHKVEKIRTR